MMTRLIRNCHEHRHRPHQRKSRKWEWIPEAIADEFKCYRDDIDSIEQEDGSEWITVRGEPVARIEYVFGWKSLQVA